MHFRNDANNTSERTLCFARKTALVCTTYTHVVSDMERMFHVPIVSTIVDTIFVTIVSTIVDTIGAQLSVAWLRKSEAQRALEQQPVCLRQTRNCERDCVMNFKEIHRLGRHTRV